jgi:hypothetical protein
MSPTIRNQATLTGIALALALGLGLVFSPATFAASPAAECEAQGGVYTAAGPDSTCTIPGTPVGNSDNTKGGSEETGPGNSDTSTHEDEEICTGVNNKPHPCPTS